MLKKIDKKTAGWGIIALNAFTVIIDIFVILKIIPYDLIGGGRLTSYQAACMSSVFGICIIGFGTLIVSIASGIIKFDRFKTFIKVWLWLSFACTSFNIITNLLGKTWFEKIVFGLICIIQAVLLFRLATDKRSSVKLLPVLPLD